LEAEEFWRLKPSRIYNSSLAMRLATGFVQLDCLINPIGACILFVSIRVFTVCCDHAYFLAV